MKEIIIQGPSWLLLPWVQEDQLKGSPKKGVNANLVLEIIQIAPV